MNINSTTIGQKPEARTSGAPGHASGDAFSNAREHLFTEFKQAFSAWKRALYTQRQALGLSLFDSGVRAVILAAVVISWLTVALAATLLFVAGVRQGLQLWSAGAWWSDLALAILLVLMLAGTAHGLRRLVHRATLAKTRRVLNDPNGFGADVASKETF